MFQSFIARLLRLRRMLVFCLVITALLAYLSRRVEGLLVGSSAMQELMLGAWRWQSQHAPGKFGFSFVAIFVTPLGGYISAVLLGASVGFVVRNRVSLCGVAAWLVVVVPQLIDPRIWGYLKSDVGTYLAVGLVLKLLLTWGFARLVYPRVPPESARGFPVAFDRLRDQHDGL